MSAVGDTKRCSDDVRKKWQDWSIKVITKLPNSRLPSQVKGKKYRLVRNYRATGGGPEEAPKLTAIEEKILAIIGPTAVNGLPSTSDTDFDTFNIHPRSGELTCNETIDSDCDDDLACVVDFEETIVIACGNAVVCWCANGCKHSADISIYG